MPTQPPRRLLLIGWDAADWKVIQPLVDAGKMPRLQRLIERGIIGDLSSLFPPLSPLVWTSIATGKRPCKHGILGFTEPTPGAVGVRPVTNLGRQTRAVWNMLHLEGLTSNVVGWWPSHPAEPIRGVMVSERYHRAHGPLDKPWPLAPHSVQPARLAAPLADLRLHPQELLAEHILPFLPKLAEIDLSADPRPGMLARTLAECTTIQAAATALIQLEPWDFMAVYYDAIDHFCHGFMRYHPPRMQGVAERDFELYQGVVEAAYRYHDAMLGVLIGLAGPEVTVLLVSDHGFHPDALRPLHIPAGEPAGPAVQHRGHGIFLMAGPGIKADQRVYGASVLDVTPTVLAAFGLPTGEDMDGKPLLTVFETPPPLTTIPSWDSRPGAAGEHPAGMAPDLDESPELLGHLVDLGYVDAPPAQATEAAAVARREWRLNLARSLVDGNRHAEAVPILEELRLAWPADDRLGVCLQQCCNALGRTQQARVVMEETFQRRQEQAVQAAETLRTWRSEHPETKPETLPKAEQQRLRKLQAATTSNPVTIHLLRAAQSEAEGDLDAAQRYYQEAEQLEPEALPVLARLGANLLQRRQWSAAEARFRRLLELDPHGADAHEGLCRSLLPQRRNAEAAAAALTAIGLRYFAPNAHFLLGVALHRLGRLVPAMQALELCLAQNPNHAEAHERLAFIYARRFQNAAAAAEHRRLASLARARVKELRAGSAPRGGPRAGRTAVASDATDLPPASVWPALSPAALAETVILVSGLPRSGTSMLMQMLAAGGLPVLVDEQRPADAGNPRGYWEYTPVKASARDASWVEQARGKAVKVVTPLLPRLPRGPAYHYRVVLMERPVAEVAASQQRLVALRGSQPRLSEAALTEALTRQMQQLRRLLALWKIPTLVLGYRDCLADPASAAARLNAFLGGGLDCSRLAAAVVPALQREGR
jgi:tetratricopeptide (TPR) repeat protein